MTTHLTRLTAAAGDSLVPIEAETDSRAVELAQDLLLSAIRADRRPASIAVARRDRLGALDWLGAFDFDPTDGRVHWCPAEGAAPIQPFAALVDWESFPASGPDALRRRRRAPA